MKKRQLELLKKFQDAYGGELQKKRKGRTHGRPLDTRNTMHLVLRSNKAKGEWSFKKPQNQKCVTAILKRFTKKFGVKVISLANVGNHLHFHIKLGNRHTYKPFICALTSAIAMAVTGKSRWNKVKGKFWDYRPFTRVIKSFRAYLNIRDYILINQFEGVGCDRIQAAMFVKSGEYCWTG